MEDKRPDPKALLSKVSHEEHQKNHGKLKIFFGYSAGVGKTYAMLEEAHVLMKAGVDVVIGYVEPHQRPATLALVEGLPQIPPISVAYKSATFNEFDIDSALKRKPELILVDELAHTNAKGCRNAKRYQDIEELLRMGIDVYTTVNVQHIEGLHDIVESITGIAVRERVPDHVFDSADKVELVDIEPEDLTRRLEAGKIYRTEQAQRALKNFFIIENLIALREISLRRTADRVHITVERNRNVTQKIDYVTHEHILICLSTSPTNGKVVRTAAKLAEAFRCNLTALFVETSSFAETRKESKINLRENIRLAEQLGAKVVTVYGDDVPYQIASYAKTGGVSRVILGRPIRKRFLGFGKLNFVDKLTTYAPNLDVLVIPNQMLSTFDEPKAGRFSAYFPKLTLSDTLKTALCLSVATLIGLLFDYIGFAEANVITIYILLSLINSVITNGRAYGIISALGSVLLFNFFFTSPYYRFTVDDPGHIITFLIMFLAALMTSTMAKRMKEYADQSSRRAYRTEVLLETSQKLQQAKNQEEILLETVNQIYKLTDKQCFLYPAGPNGLETVLVQAEADEKINQYLSDDEFAVAGWTYLNNKHAGATTDTLSGAKCLYLTIRSNDRVFAVVGIAMDQDGRLDSFEKGLLISILDEVAMMLEKENALIEKNAMRMRANNEQLRANLLRAISHDLRTPLTSIAGGSDFLLESIETVDKETLRSMLSDIATEAGWMSALVENLLNMTRIQDGQLTVNKVPELMDEVISAAILKVIKRSDGKKIHLAKSEEMIFVPMDARLMMQVIINLLENAFKHTKESCEIEISYQLEDNQLVLLVSDNGGGIPIERVEKIFEPFFTASHATATHDGNDKRRGMGLGLNICKSIIEAHGGTITAKNNDNGGATFKITLPI